MSRIVKCKHCKKEFDLLNKSKNFMLNHSRWCDMNPRSKEDKEKIILAMQESKIKSKINNQYTKAKSKNEILIMSEEIRNKISNSNKNKKYTEETKKKMSEGSLKSKHRRLRRKTIMYNNILLDSTWELELAKRLDFINIEWIRPEPLKWTDHNNIEHNYFADFYLPKYDIYLDPKNPHVYNVQNEKIKCLLSQYKNIKFILSLDECKNFILS